MIDLQDKRVLVTGASSGLGAEIAKGLAAAGAVVGLCARRPERLAAVLAEVQAHSPASRSWTVDLADLDGLDTFAARAIQDLGGLDVLVNNAGIPKRRWAWHHRPDEVADVMRTNLESPIRLTLATLDALAATSGHVVFVGSVAARLAPPAEAVYAASKAGITAFAEGLAVDLGVAGSPIGVHVVQPGVLATDLFDLPDNDGSISDIEPLGAAAIVAPILEALGSGAAETYVPSWFADIVSIKAGDPSGFTTGTVEYTRQRLTDLDRPRPDGPGTTS